MRVHAHSFAVELGVGVQQSIEAAVAVARDVQNNLVVVRCHRLLAAAVAPI